MKLIEDLIWTFIGIIFTIVALLLLSTICAILKMRSFFYD